MSSKHPVSFTLHQVVPISADEAFALLCDWEDHGRWVPFTSMDVRSNDEFVAYTGIGPFKLEDNMCVTHRDVAGRSLSIVKTGPVVTGTASFSVRPFSETSSVVTWVESVQIPYLPGFAAPVAAKVGKLLFKAALRRLAPR
jgi:hypothetical protein